MRLFASLRHSLSHLSLRKAGAGVARARILLLLLVFGGVYGVIAGRLVYLGFSTEASAQQKARAADATAQARPDVIDRKGRLIATDIRTPSLFAEPQRIIDADEATYLLLKILPDLDRGELRARLTSKRYFAWLKREITPEQQKAIYRLGIPGIGFLKEYKRVYPNGALAAHVLGQVNVDNQGILGLEKWIDSGGLSALHQAGFATNHNLQPVEIALDLDVQQAVRDELIAGKERFKAQAANALVLDVNTGEIVSMVSLPDFDPNKPSSPKDPARFNRLMTGVFEMGSTFKAMTTAMALDSGKVTLNSRFDATQPLRYGKFTIHDFHAQRRVLSVPEIFTYSSNIGSAKIALSMGIDAHKAFLRKLGLLDRLRTELPESAMPLIPNPWGELNTVTIAFGHGLSVTPLQAVMATAALINGGYLITPTFMRRTETEAKASAPRVIKQSTSDQMRYLMRLNVEVGSAKRAEVEGYFVGGKTGTSEKVERGRYSKNKVLTTFMGIFPADKPRYLVMVMLDEPQKVEGAAAATAGLNATPVAGKIIQRIAPLLGVEPRINLPTAQSMLQLRNAAN
ncbi:MAG: penicillin-binding protein 2 [Xanthobacteraceae bacterium]|nr:penicillin-binding protein 2 [Xanthobacteraceae bacterium]MBX3533691.1 penicillin-binding protein 2 [Xanthobacteraceae bacterium]MBX3548974.1 penicillin-binding protein 2 [Xanthobacteraceae bacterium]MCW5676515.1 penicillin-binding protein 2 [Xanthobacteraceae bacterium]